MKISIDREKCASLGVCESISPDHFEINDDGDLDVLRADVAGDEAALIQRAVTSCPSGALSLVED
ncbi:MULTISPECIES: ferredoxin [unclassified Nocardioides]|uniref:ferredoxin n=1 Tax=unclassified Nocardioides TaxID=2615069 RepID=UPI0006FA3E76|nr:MULTISPECIES: ferredoxin [unclassified Nocardioides]KQY50061.1 ferredoxin [Nocardioides sp. Root140]KQZ75685.1 ferredoxin [Nocardioides sp. Root151]KRF14757.1 ferredoxin [Nocardioides sp. Soil796]